MVCEGNTLVTNMEGDLTPDHSASCLVQILYIVPTPKLWLLHSMQYVVHPIYHDPRINEYTLFNFLFLFTVGA